ncbi:hypothetical protein [Streptomyces malaysiensis]|uniref:hypothetical protein n=2 Tax=Streptomyces TaxID=1883 RepID=UPI0031FE3F22
MEKEGMTVWITAPQASVLAALDKRRRLEEQETKAELIRAGLSSKEARIRIINMRPETWPPLEDIVASSLRRRLADEDLAREWDPLTPDELDRLKLSGRWPGPNNGIRLVQRNYDFPAALARQLRTAAWRMSERALAELHERGLVGSGKKLTEEQRRVRDELALQLYPPARIVRQALTDYPPALPE